MCKNSWESYSKGPPARSAGFMKALMSHTILQLLCGNKCKLKSGPTRMHVRRCSNSGWTLWTKSLSSRAALTTKLELLPFRSANSWLLWANPTQTGLISRPVYKPSLSTSLPVLHTLRKLMAHTTPCQWTLPHSRQKTPRNLQHCRRTWPAQSATSAT